MNITPYMHYDGIPTFRDSFIESLYDKMVRDGTDKTVFYGGDVLSRRDFLNKMKSVGTVLIVAVEDNTSLACGWINGFECNIARVHFCLFSEVWGERSIEIGKEMIEKALSLTGCDMLTGMIPEKNKRAIDFSIKCGAKLMGILPYGSTGPTAFLYYVR